MRIPIRIAVPLAALGLGVSVLPALAGSQAPTAGRPFDYIKQAAELSQPDYEQVVTESVEVPTHDGETIYVEVTRPDPKVYGSEQFPVILEASPYHGTIADRAGTRMFPDPMEGDTRIGLTGYFAPRGYAVAMMDLRGTGRSTGCLDHLGPNDAQDLTTVIDWLVAQDWSVDRVGMTGHSYVGSTPSVAAAQQPEGLVTIVPSAGLASMYDHQFNKGVPWKLQYIGPTVAYEALAIDRDLPPGAGGYGGTSGDNWEHRGGPNPQFGCGLPNSAATSGPGQVTGQYEQWHAERDSRAGAAAADIPIFMIHGVNDNAARIPAAEWFFADREPRAGDKVWIGQWDHGSTNGRCGDRDGARALHPTCRFDQMKYAIHAWFDKHLKQRDVNTGPAVEAFLNGGAPMDVTQVLDAEKWATRVVTRKQWAESGDQVLTLYPDATDMSLRTTPPTEEGSASFNGGLNAVLAGVENGNLTFASAPFDRDTVVLGLPQLLLQASQSGPQVNHLTATLYREDAEGNREIANVCAIQPMLREGVETVTPITPGEAMDLPMQCFTAAHWVPRGQHLELEISTRTPHHASFASDPNITVFTGPEASRYELPVLDKAVLHKDVPLYETEREKVVPGDAQAPETGTVVVPVGAAGQRVEPLTAAGYEFTSEVGKDNAKLEVLATPSAPADLDLYLQRKQDDGTWGDDLAAGENDPLDGETLTAGRLEPGEYRVLVVNWAGAPTDVTLELTFYNSNGVAGADTVKESSGQARHFLMVP